MRLLALHRDADVDEDAGAFLKYLMDVANGSLPQTEDYRIGLSSSINLINTIQSLCVTVLSDADHNYKQLLVAQMWGYYKVQK